MRFIIVIPTLNRADVLHWSVESVLEQRGDHEFQIIVSNNCSDDHTKEVVNGFGDPRIKYIEPKERLSMSKHWEYASNYIDFDDTIVMYLGDDDILSPSAFEIAGHLFRDHDIDAVTSIINNYWTPDCAHKRAGFLLQPRIDGYARMLESKKILSLVAGWPGQWINLPKMSRGFVRGALLPRLKAKGPLFNKASPDIYTSVSLAALGIRYCQVAYPLSLGVATPTSNGLNCKMVSPSSIGQEFLDSSKRDFEHNYFIKSVAFQVLDCLEDIQISHNIDLDISYKRFYRAALWEISYHDVNAAMASLKRVSNHSELTIYRDFVFQKIKKASQSVISNTPFIGDVARRLKEPLDVARGFKKPLAGDKNSFRFVGDLKKQGINDPQACLQFIEESIDFKVIR
jgi:glycosyltransferase involved in cell wall biosynthesis